jgi:hypothetical protein
MFDIEAHGSHSSGVRRAGCRTRKARRLSECDAWMQGRPAEMERIRRTENPSVESMDLANKSI